MTCGARAPSNQLAGVSSLRRWLRTRASTQTTFVKVAAAFSSLLLVWFAGDT